MVGGFEKADGGTVILDGQEVKRPTQKMCDAVSAN